nr:putative nuclease HARBI1 isoform X2 [Tanacetum cinerariifolium]
MHKDSKIKIQISQQSRQIKAKNHDISILLKNIKSKIKIQDHKHAKGTSKEFPRPQGFKSQDVTRMQTSGSGNTFLLAVAFFFWQWEVPSDSGNFLTSSGNALCILFPTEWARLMKSISQPWSNDVKRIKYKQAHEATRKDVKRAFGVLKKKWAIIRTPARSRSLKRITHLMYTCIILHNMIRKEKGKAISPDFYPEEQHRR